jgi:hypothetical protein
MIDPQFLKLLSMLANIKIQQTEPIMLGDPLSISPLLFLA